MENKGCKMQFSNYENFLQGQCARCSQILTSDENKVMKITLESCNQDYFDTSNSFEEVELTNFEAISKIYGLSRRILASQMFEYYKSSKVMKGDEFDLESEEIPNDDIGLLDPTNQNLAFCNTCGLLFTQLYQINNIFMNFSDKTSLLSKTIYKGFCKNKEQHRVVLNEPKIKVENESSDIEYEPIELPLMIDKDSGECEDCHLENNTEDGNSKNGDALSNWVTLDVGSVKKSFSNGHGSTRTRKQNSFKLKNVAIVLDRIPEGVNTETTKLHEKRKRGDVKGRYLLRKTKASGIYKVEDASDDDDGNFMDDGKLSSDSELSEKESRHCNVKSVKRVKMKSSSDDSDDNNIILTEIKMKSKTRSKRRKRNKNYFPCFSCTETFSDEEELKSHRSTQHPDENDDREIKDEQHEDETKICEEPFFCRECGFSFTTATAVNIHNRTIHQYQKKFDCKHCDESFSNTMSVLHHLSSVHKEFVRIELYRDIYWCIDCNDEIAYRRFSFLQKHFQQSKHSSYEISCAFCGKKFQDKDSLFLHKKFAHAKKVKIKSKTHRGKGRYECPFCEEHFPTMKEQLKHKSSHPKEEQLFKCQQCPKIYTLLNSLRVHQQMIHSEVKFQCEECGLSIAGNIQYRSHCRMHAEKASGIKKLCDLCGKNFNTQKQLLKHKYIFHSRKEETQCPICGYISRTKFYFKRHMKIHENNGTVRKRKPKEQYAYPVL